MADQGSLARFVVESVNQLDLPAMTRSYDGAASETDRPAMLLTLLIYAYANSSYHDSRKIKQATYDSVAFRFIAAKTHHDQDTLCTFRKRFLKEIESLLQVLSIAREIRLLKLGQHRGPLHQSNAQRQPPQCAVLRGCLQVGRTTASHEVRDLYSRADGRRGRARARGDEDPRGASAARGTLSRYPERPKRTSSGRPPSVDCGQQVLYEAKFTRGKDQTSGQATG